MLVCAGFVRLAGLAGFYEACDLHDLLRFIGRVLMFSRIGARGFNHAFSACCFL